MIRDRLVCRIANEKWQQRLLAEEKLTYEKPYKLLLSLEASEKVKDLSSSVSVPQVHQVHRPDSRQQSTQVTAAVKNKSTKPSRQCYHCGGGHMADKCSFDICTAG